MCLNNEDEIGCDKKNPWAIMAAFALVVLALSVAAGEWIFRRETESGLETLEANSRVKSFIEAVENEEIRTLEDLFREIHFNDGGVKQLITALDESSESLRRRSASFGLIYRFELSMHHENAFLADQCLRSALGTDGIADTFYGELDPGFVTRIAWKVKGRGRRRRFTFASEVLAAMFKISSYYADFFKDAFFIYFLSHFFQDINDSFAVRISLLLVAILVFTELCNVALLIAWRGHLGLSKKGLTFMIAAFPLIPAISIFQVNTVDSAYNIHGYKGQPVIVATKIMSQNSH